MLFDGQDMLYEGHLVLIAGSRFAHLLAISQTEKNNNFNISQCIPLLEGDLTPMARLIYPKN